MIDTEWLRGRVRKFISKSNEADFSTNTVLSDLAKNGEQILALRINEILRGKNRHFAASRAEKLVEQAIKNTREKVRSVELAKCAAEAEITRYRDQQHQTDIQIRKIEEKIERQLAAAEWRAAACEERANKAEETLRRLEDELHTRTIRTKSRVERSAA
ncbi:MAG: hypothetical protein P8Y71_16840 [Pseudolabrys sp.]